MKRALLVMSVGGGVYGLLTSLTVIPSLSGRPWVFSLILVLVCLYYLLLVIGGVLVSETSVRGVSLLMYLYALQIPMISFGGFIFLLNNGIKLNFSISFSPEIKQLFLSGLWNVTFDSTLGIGVGINALALIAFVYLLFLRLHMLERAKLARETVDGSATAP
jgi:hypothetical protein